MGIMFDMNLLPLKIHYCLFNAGIVPMLAYGSVFARQAGLSAVTVGSMWTLLLLTSVCVKIALSGYADKYEKRRLIFCCSVFLCAFVAFLLSFISTSTIGRPVHILCHTETFFESCRVHDVDTAALNEIKYRDPGGMVTCRFSCDYREDFAQEMCSLWRNKHDCTSDSLKEIKFDAWIRKTHLFSVNRCIYGTLAKIMFADIPDTYPSPHCLNHTDAVKCTVRCDNAELMNALKVESSPLLNDLMQFKTWILFFLFLCYMCNQSLNFSLSDTICFALLDDKAHLYGRQRLFGSIGFGIMTLMGGVLTDWFSNDTFDKNYRPLFLTASAILLVDFFLTFKVKIEQRVISSSVVKDVSMIFYNTRVFIFAVWCFLMGMFCGQCWQFLFWHLEDISTVEDLQWVRTIQGLATLSNTIVGEIPVFFISGWVIKRLGHYNAMSLILFSSTMRFHGYSMLDRPIWVLPIELLSGFIFSMSYVIIASYSNLIALPGTESTVQAVFSATFEGLGMACGSMVGGMIYGAFDGYILFELMSYLAAVATVVHVLIQKHLPSIPNQLVHCAKNPTVAYTSPAEAINVLDSTSL